MNDELRVQLEILEHTLAELESALKAGLGFAETISYMGICFNVSKRFVIADLSPLAFFHLVEHIDGSAVEAVVRLYDRLLPLLSCPHQWTALKRETDEHIRSLSHTADGPFICKCCTAYALGTRLPAVGREMAERI